MQAEQSSRLGSLRQWIKRTQEVLTHRSLNQQTFSQLYNLMRTKRLAEIALLNILENKGAQTAGVDGIRKECLGTAESQTQLVNEINEELCAKTYKPKAVRRVYIDKPNGDKRPLGIPTLKDRVVQEMLRLILEPIYEAKFYKHSYGFRPFRSTHHAALRLKDLIGKRKYTIAIEGDIRKCFDRVQHQKLVEILRVTIKDERIIKLVQEMLKSGVMEDGAWHVSDEGTPQGGIISPLFANVYLNELDQFINAKWGNLTPREQQARKRKKQDQKCFITRYADDFVVLVMGTREQAELLKTEIATFLANELYLELSEEKTVITDVETGFDFLGFNIRKRRGVTLITPSRKALKKFRENVKQKVWEGFGTDTDAGAIEHLNRFLIGWGMYYRRVSSARTFRRMDHYVWWRVFKTSYRLRNPKLRPAEHYRAHYIPYCKDIRTVNWKHKGRNYGAWADESKTRAFIVINLAFFPIRYVNFHPQLNPYIQAERTILEKRVGSLEPSPDQLPGAVFNPDFGAEWETIRKTILENDGYRCYRCKKPISGRDAQIHHRQKRKGFKNRKKANLLENLIPLCPMCHQKTEREALIQN